MKILKKYINQYNITALSLLALTAQVHAESSTTWQNFIDAQTNGTEPILPDFSYAGYKYSEENLPDIIATETNTFDVTDYGAIADDGLSDFDAIQDAIDAAESNGSGIVYFPAGLFHLNTADAPRDGESLLIQSSNIILRGEGSGEDGTRLFMEVNFEPTDPSDLYSTPFMFHIGPDSTSESLITPVAGSAERETFEVPLASVSNVREGQWITIYMKSTAALSDPDFMDEYSADETWTRTLEGVILKERHQIVSVNEETRTITLKEPLHAPIKSGYGVSIYSYPNIEEVGIEDIRFVGNWTGNFVHHRSALDDGGWSAISWDNSVNSWIRDCVFENWNYGLHLDGVSASTLLNLSFEGTKGHFSMHTRRGYGVLAAQIKDHTSHHHGPSVGYRSAGTVFWRFAYQHNSSWDAHSDGPYATLIDASHGGMLYGRCGGGQVSLPNHMKRFTLWNFDHTGADTHHDFWKDGPNDRDRFIKPIIVGFSGSDSTFEENSVELIESMGSPVDEESLFESQLINRLGALPQFLEDVKTSWDPTLIELLEVEPIGKTILSENFNELEEGPLVNDAGWFYSDKTSGDATRDSDETIIVNQSLNINMTGPNAEGEIVTLFPNDNSVNFNNLYASLDLTVHSIGFEESYDKTYVFGFGSSNGNTLRARTWIIGSADNPGQYRMGVTTKSGSSVDIISTEELLDVGVTYQIIIQHNYDGANAITTLWINPESRTSASISSAPDASTTPAAFFIHQDDKPVGDITIDNLKIADSFNAAKPDDVFTGSPLNEEGTWYESEWYGAYYNPYAPWIFHFEHGWQFTSDAEEENSTYLWDDGLQAWIYMSESAGRWMYLYDEIPAWIYAYEVLEEDTERVFYNSGSETYFSVGRQ